jgi:hypothetical protein
MFLYRELPWKPDLVHLDLDGPTQAIFGQPRFMNLSLALNWKLKRPDRFGAASLFWQSRLDGAVRRSLVTMQ